MALVIENCFGYRCTGSFISSMYVQPKVEVVIKKYNMHGSDLLWQDDHLSSAAIGRLPNRKLVSQFQSLVDVIYPNSRSSFQFSVSVPQKTSGKSVGMLNCQAFFHYTINKYIEYNIKSFLGVGYGGKQP